MKKKEKCVDTKKAVNFNIHVQNSEQKVLKKCQFYNYTR